jgi:bifunctional DNA-binding transcriptional regulator/antitoxin component of YhaV-PrlF toxin-antitoxin module
MKTPQVVFKGTVQMHGSASFIEVPIDPKAVFGKMRAPVKVTLNGYTFRSTIAAMGGPPAIPLRQSNREAAGLKGGEIVEVRLDLDDEPRVIMPPADLAKALKAAPPAWHRWKELSYSHQREHAEAVEGAKKPETRQRRIESAVAMLKAATPRAAKTSR